MNETKIAWGAKVSPLFKMKVLDICAALGINPDYLMAVMAFESGRTFSPRVLNKAGSGAVGLIQFMPDTAHALGTSTEELSRMSAEDQLDYVHKYLKYSNGRIKSLSDMYMAILLPSKIGKEENAVVFDSKDPKHPKQYLQNKGLDVDKDGVITKAEATSLVRGMLIEGLKYSA